MHREVSNIGRILLANPEMGLYCPIIRFLVDQNKTNNKACMAGVYGHSDVCLETCFLQIYYKNILCSTKTCQSDALQHGLLGGGDASTSAACQAAASPRWSALAGARAAKRESRVRARGRSSSHATRRSLVIAAAMATCCTWVCASPPYLVRRRPTARPPWARVPATPARRF